MRVILVLLGIVALVIVLLMSLGMIRLEQQGDASLPAVNVDVEGGRLPEFEAETGEIDIGTSNRTVELPTVEMRDTTVSVPTVNVEQAGEPTPEAGAER